VDDVFGKELQRGKLEDVDLEIFTTVGDQEEELPARDGGLNVDDLDGG